MDIDASMNWFLEHWYYWIIAVLGAVLFYIYQDLQRLKNMYRHWTQERLKEKIKSEIMVNPPHKTANWLVKGIYGTHKEKVIGKILSFKDLPNNPSNDVTVTVSTRLFPYFKIPLGRKKIFHYDPKQITYDAERKVIKVPHDFYWSQHPSGEFILMSPSTHENWHIVNKEIDRDLKTLAIDGFASQMASYSSVRPTWGHEDNVMTKETENKFGFLDKFGRKGKQEKEKEG